ncbi:GNAT family N-acetyltransferase [Nocardioides marmotae]|uniref:GNAT family N-acetyltransferase n=1 Tax=Nocardioides marmotae TaxID=2663857 RepID=UPI001659FDB0|nr:GNAT family N-acetyltransferase [Nocardioides marmotae]MBC9732428.1 GNAT family N-acetyltransferase [Nocardioides marmotae]
MAEPAPARPPVDLSAVAWPCRTERLLLRRVTPADAEAVWEVRHHPASHEWLTSGPSDRETYVADFDRPERLDHLLVVEHDGQVIGDLMLRLTDAWAQAEVAELGWVLHPDHTGHGYATEAAAELLRICFEDLRLRRVTAGCFAENTASWRIMERLGMRRESHTVADALHRSGRWLDSYAYAILAEEWRAGRTARGTI